ncbi:hypothetical protein MMC25_003137 [Agyrium rufum]|nr:hypothetical protein [Agyrium rufum]
MTAFRWQSWFSGGAERPPVLLKIRSAKWFILATICTAVFTDIFLYCIIVPVLPFALTLRAGVPPPDVQHWISILLAVYGAALLALSPTCGWLADKSPSRRMPLIIGLFALGGATVLLCLGRSIAVLVVGRLLQGFSAAVVWTVGLALLVDTVGEDGIGQAMGYVAIGMSVAFLLGPLLGGVVYNRAGYYAVYYMAFALIILDIILRVLLVEKKMAAKWRTDETVSPETSSESEDKSLEATTLPVIPAPARMSAMPLTDNNVAVSKDLPEDAREEAPSRLPPVITLLASRRLLAALWGCLVQALLMTAFDSVLPLRVHSIWGWDSTGAGLIFFALAVPSFFAPLVGGLADRYGPRWPATIGFLLACPALILLRLVDHDSIKQKVLLCVLLFILGITLNIVMTPLLAEITYAVEAKEKQHPGVYGEKGAYAQAYGLFNTAFAGGTLLGPIWAGYVSSKAGWGTMAWSLGLLSALSAIPIFIWTGGLLTERHNAESRWNGRQNEDELETIENGAENWSMEEVGRTYEQQPDQSPSVESAFSVSSFSPINQELVSRIRSLLLARNGHYPPCTPCPSPAFAVPPCNENVIDPFESQSSSRRTIRPLTLVKLAPSTSEKREMGVINFESVSVGSQRNTYNSYDRSVSPDSRNSTSSMEGHRPSFTGINHKTLGAALGTDRRESTHMTKTAPPSDTRRAKSPVINSKPFRRPRYVIRTATPLKPKITPGPSRPPIQHVPGSFKSSFTASISTTSEPVTPTAKISLLESPSNVSGEKVEDTKFSSVPDTSQEEEGFTCENESSPARGASAIRPSLDTKRSETTIRTNSSARHIVHPLLKPSREPSYIHEPLPPMITSFDHGHPHDNQDSTQASKFEDVPQKAEPNTVRAQRQINLGPTIGETAGTDDLSLPISEQNLPPPNSARGGYSPPNMTNNTVGRANEADKKYSSMALPIDLSSEYSRTTPPTSAKTPLSRDPTVNLSPSEGCVLGLPKFPEAEHYRSYPEPWMTSRKTSIPQLHPMPRRTLPGLEEFINGASYHPRSPSGSSANVSRISIESSDVAQLIPTPHSEQKRLRPQASLVSTPSALHSPNRQHWLQHFLGKHGSISEDHLTQRPSRIESGDMRHRAVTVPTFNHLDAAADMLSQRGIIRSGPKDESALTKQLQIEPESFSRIILDLEALMREVLQIAKHVADTEESGEHMRDSASPVHVSETSEDISTGTTVRRQFHDFPQEDETNGSLSLTSEPYRNRRLPTNKHLDYKKFDSNTGLDSTGGSSSSIRKLKDPADLISRSQKTVAGLSVSSNRTNSIHARQVAATLGLPEPFDDAIETTIIPSYREPIGATRQVANHSTVSTRTGDVSINDWGLRKQNGYQGQSEAFELPVLLQRPISLQTPLRDQANNLSRDHAGSSISRRNLGNTQYSPQIQQRTSSIKLHDHPQLRNTLHDSELGRIDSSDDSYDQSSFTGLSPSQSNEPGGLLRRGDQPSSAPGALAQHDTITSLRGPSTMPQGNDVINITNPQERPSLKNVHHFSIRGPQGFSFRHSHKRAPIARDWSPRRKRYVAAVTCINTALLGILIGVYAGEVPAIQYAIADEHHYTILGNVLFYLGLAIPTALFWPLPLLHGRKPYTLAAMTILLPLQFPQAVVVGSFRSPSASYRTGLLLPRAFAGVAMGFANINFQTTLLDLFGASLQSGNPHQEIVDNNDVRRHGGGMGVWLGIWTWCYIGSIGLGFLIGALIISGLNVAWGFWFSIVLIAAVLILNVMTPEVRRSPYRRSTAEVSHGDGDVSRRIARGEVKMHLHSTGPKHWWEEVLAGHMLMLRMLKQPSFVIIALYIGWIYAQVVMVIILLGALLSRYYRFRPQYVGLCVFALSLGAFLAIPFQRANLFSRSRHHRPRTDSMTFEKRFTWTSHLIRRAVFTIVLPFVGLAYTLSSSGPSLPWILPTLFAGCIGFLSNLAIAECFGICMETFDTSDLQPGMTGRPRRVLPDEVRRKRTNFSCFPRVCAAFSIAQTFSFLIAAAATGTGGVIERRLGAQIATAVVAGALLGLTLLLTGVLVRWRNVQIVPRERYDTVVLGGEQGIGPDNWLPIIVGHPSGTHRRISWLEEGAMTRWTEIRRRNRLLATDDPRIQG